LVIDAGDLAIGIGLAPRFYDGRELCVEAVAEVPEGTWDRRRKKAG
jgi:hypothetical protein